MDWDKLRIFHMVAEAGSFTHAGEALKLSQSAVSRHISALEESLGVSLFHRHARGLILTEAGELLHQGSRDIFTRLSMIEGQLTDAKDQSAGSLKITVAEFVGASWLARHLDEFRSAHDEIRLSLLLEDRVLNLGMREADAAIRLYRPEQQDLIQRHLATVQFVVCAHKNYLKKYGTPAKVSDLKDHCLIGYPDHVVKPYDNPNWLFELAGVDPEKNDKVILINSVSAIYGAVAAAAGIAVLPKYMVTANKDLEVILPSTRPESVDMYFVYPEERRHSKRISLFRDFLLECVAKTEF
jgi:DNA-binding transcriptional LysR family regulator